MWCNNCLWGIAFVEESYCELDWATCLCLALETGDAGPVPWKVFQENSRNSRIMQGCKSWRETSRYPIIFFKWNNQIVPEDFAFWRHRQPIWTLQQLKCRIKWSVSYRCCNCCDRCPYWSIRRFVYLVQLKSTLECPWAVRRILSIFLKLKSF